MGGVRWFVLTLVLAFAICGCQASEDGCPGGTVRDPGPAIAVDLSGRVAQAIETGELRLGSRTVTLDSSTRVEHFCDDSSGRGCYAFVSVARNDARRASRVSYEPFDGDAFSLNTNAYRFGADHVVVAGGWSLPLAKGFEAGDCPGTGRAGLKKARFGATFYLETTSGAVTRATCNGCG